MGRELRSMVVWNRGRRWVSEIRRTAPSNQRSVDGSELHCLCNGGLNFLSPDFIGVVSIVVLKDLSHEKKNRGKNGGQNRVQENMKEIRYNLYVTETGIRTKRVSNWVLKLNGWI